MLNNSKHFLKSASNGSGKIDNGLSNGKAKCFICMKDTSDALCLDDDDYLSLYIRYRSRVYHSRSNKHMNRESEALNHDNIIHQNVVIDTTKTTNLISACECDKMVHIECLTRYCLINLSFQCPKCRNYYHFDFIKGEGGENLKFFLFAFLFAIFHIAIFVLAILFYINFFNFGDSFIYYTYVIGAMLTILNILTTIPDIKHLIFLYKSHNIIPRYISQALGDRKSLELSKAEECFNFLLNKHKCAKIELFEKRMNNTVFQETVMKEEMKLSRFILENNRFYHINKVTTEVFDEKEVDIFKVEPKKALLKPPGNETLHEEFQLVKRQKSYHQQASLKPPIDKPKLLVKSRTKNNKDDEENKGGSTSIKNSQISRKNPMMGSLHEIQEEDQHPVKRETINNNSNIYSVENSEANLLGDEDKILLRENKIAQTYLNKYNDDLGETIENQLKKHVKTAVNIKLKSGELQNNLTPKYVNCDSIVE